MKAGTSMAKKDDMLELMSHLVPISDFSKGKTAKIFEDIKKNKCEYIVLKNNQPSAVLMSVENYSDILTKARKMEALLDRIEEARLLAEAKKVSETYDPDKAYTQESILSELGITEEEIDSLVDSVNIE